MNPATSGSGHQESTGCCRHYDRGFVVQAALLPLALAPVLLSGGQTAGR